MTDATIIAIVGAVSTVSIGVLNAVVSLKLHQKVEVVHQSVNGILRDRDEATKASSHAEGMADQRAEDRAGQAHSQPPQS